MNHRIFRIGLAVMLALPALAQAIPKDYEKRFGDLERQTSVAANHFSSHAQARLSQSLEERLSEGIVLQASGDYQRASYIFMDIVSRSEWRGQPGYQTAQLQLARSLYEEGYYRLSERYLIDLLRTGTGSERTEGVLLLLQVAQKTGDWDDVNLALSDVTDFSHSPGYLYIVGRSKFLQGDNDTAKASLRSINGNDEWAVKAAYLLGVIEVQERNLDSALEYFAEVERSKAVFRDSQKVHDLAVMAQARLYYEQTQWGKAVEKYQQIPETSDLFSSVLYEMGWTHIRQEDYKSAQQSFEILLLSNPEDSHAAETRQLLADIKRELGRYDEAAASYQTIVDEFEPVVARLEDEKKDLDSHKVSLKASIENERFGDVNIVPNQARGLIAVGTDVNQIETMINGLSVSDSNSSESEMLISEIRAVLAEDGNLRNLPEFQQYTQLTRELRVNTLLLGVDFTDENQSIPSSMQPAVDAVSRMPRTRRESQIVAAMQQSAREEREARLHRLKLKAEGFQHRTKIIKSWMDSGKISALSEGEQQTLKNQISEIEGQLADLKRQQYEIESRIAEVRSLNGGGSRGNQEIRDRLDTLQSALESEWSKASASGKASKDYLAMIKRARALLASIDSFDQQLENVMHERAEAFRRRLEQERELVATERERFTGAKSDVGDAAGVISIRYWQTVYGQIRDMVLNADLGMVDIAWLQKDARSKELSDTMDERKKEREILEQDFKQFLKESGQE